MRGMLLMVALVAGCAKPIEVCGEPRPLTSGECPNPDVTCYECTGERIMDNGLPAHWYTCDDGRQIGPDTTPDIIETALFYYCRDLNPDTDAPPYTGP